MNLEDFEKVLRTRWITIAVMVIIALTGAIAMTLLTTPLYAASTKLFVSTTSGVSASELYQGNRLSQERVLSYTELLQGKTLAQRTIDRMGLDMAAAKLQQEVQAKTKPDTVLIDVSVLDESPVRARDIANALSDEFVSMVNELETPRPGARPDARVVVQQRAEVPTEAAVPKPARNIIAGLALGALLGLGLALLRDRLDNTVKDRDTLEQLTGAGIVGTIPFDKSRRAEPAISFDTDRSAIAESFRKLRTNLQFLSVDNPPRLIVITSSVPNETKTTTAINIALVLAEAKHKVLIIDGDLRRPSLGKYLRLVESVGLSTVLSGSASLDDVLQDTQYPHLTVLAAGSMPPNPSELLGSMAAKNLLSELKSRFDYVIVDTPPLLAVTDGAILAADCDGALLMARYGSTKRDQISHAVRSLENVGASLLGVALTMSPTRRRASYSYDYYYGSDKDDTGGRKSVESTTKSAGPGSNRTNGAPTSVASEGVVEQAETQNHRRS